MLPRFLFSEAVRLAGCLGDWQLIERLQRVRMPRPVRVNLHRGRVEPGAAQFDCDGFAAGVFPVPAVNPCEWRGVTAGVLPPRVLLEALLGRPFAGGAARPLRMEVV